MANDELYAELQRLADKDVGIARDTLKRLNKLQTENDKLQKDFEEAVEIQDVNYWEGRKLREKELEQLQAENKQLTVRIEQLQLNFELNLDSLDAKNRQLEEDIKMLKRKLLESLGLTYGQAKATIILDNFEQTLKGEKTTNTTNNIWERR